MPLATVATPNYFEACTLAGMEKLETVQDLAEAAERISKLGPRYVVVKGGIDFPGEEAVDVLWDGENATAFSSPKIGEHRVSGAGCTLAAAITAELAKGTEIYDAVRIAKDVVTDGIRARVPGHTPFDTVWQGAYVPPLPTPEKKGTVISASLASSAAEAAESQGSGCGCGNDGCSK